MVDFSYANVEAALARTYGTDDDLGRFRGRLSTLQKGGLFGAEYRPGKGHRLRYGPDQMWRWIFCMELSELGFMPAVSLKLVAEFWESRIQAIFVKAETAAQHDAGDGDIVLLLIGVSLMSKTFEAGAVPNINFCPLRKLAARLALGMQPRRVNDPLPPRALAINLSARLRVFHEHLAEAHLAAEPPDEKPEGVDE